MRHLSRVIRLSLIGGTAAIYTPAQAVAFTRIVYSPGTDYLQHMLQLSVDNQCDTVGIWDEHRPEDRPESIGRQTLTGRLQRCVTR